jgi:hypothetical protein
MTQMIKTFKDIRALTNQIDWEVNSIKHDVVAKNIRGQIIKEMLLKKCFFYYEFEEIMRDSLIVTSFYVMKSIRSDLIDVKTENTQETDEKNTQETDEENIEIIIDEDYENWIVNNSAMDKDFDTNSLFEEEAFKSSRVELIKRAKQSYVARGKKSATSTTDRRFKRQLKVELIFDSDEDQSKSRKRESKKNRSLANALMKMQNIKSKNFFKQFEFEQIQLQKRFEAKTIQRDQHHKKIILKQKEMIVIIKMQHEKKMMRLQIELKKTTQKNA